jgi:hypothetical protein
MAPFTVTVNYSDDEEALILWLAERFETHSDRVEVYHVQERFQNLDKKQIHEMLRKLERYEILFLNGNMAATLSPRVLHVREAILNPEPVDQVAQTQKWWYSTRWGLATFVALAALFVLGQVVAILADLKTLFSRPEPSATAPLSPDEKVEAKGFSDSSVEGSPGPALKDGSP